MNIKQIIIIRKDLGLSTGKVAAQASHASTNAILKLSAETQKEIVIEKTDTLNHWLKTDFKKIILSVKNEDELLKYYDKLSSHGFSTVLIKDLAYNELNEPTYTAIGVEPLESYLIDPIVKRLQVFK